MNKRILDGTGMWKPDKIARIQPEWMRSEDANWIPLALANGVFEATFADTYEESVRACVCP